MPSVSDPRALARLLELILSTAQAGLAFSKDRFDIGRFRALQHAVAEFIASDQGVAYERVENWIALDSHYPTPKLDVRALILDSQQRVLLVREASDSRWTLPGGWCDVNESPADAVVRETQEESGLEVRAIRLLALLDKHKHPHPPQLPHALKAFFFCHVTGGSLQQQTDETSAAEYFPVDALPPLSEHRVLASQIQTLWQRIHAETPEALTSPPTSWSHRAADGLTLTTSSRRTRQIDRPVDERLPPSPIAGSLMPPTAAQRAFRAVKPARRSRSNAWRSAPEAPAIDHPERADGANSERVPRFVHSSSVLVDPHLGLHL